MLCFRSFPVATKSIDKWGGGEGEYQFFLMKFFCFTVLKNFIKKQFSASLNLGIEINRNRERRVSRFTDKFNFSHSTKKYRRGTLPHFRRILVFKIFMHKRRVSQFSVRIFLSHNAEKLCRRILQCFTFFECRKFSCIGGVCHDFLSGNFSLTVLESFVGEPFCVSEIFWYLILFWIRWGDCQDFLSEIFCRTVPKSFIAEPFCAVLQKFSGSDKVY